MIGRRPRSKAGGIAVLGAVYLLAAAVGWSVAEATSGAGLLAAGFAADLAATAVVFLASVMLNNTSVYDPFWSVAPILLAAWWAVEAPGGGARTVVMLILIAVWGIRLTGNFLTGWRGLGHEDWRYEEYRRLGPTGYWSISLVGLHLVPTLVVFGGLLPVYAALTDTGGFGPVDLIATVVTAAAVVLEGVADHQKRTSLRRDPAALVTGGVWSFLRHPNYTGEVAFWWGLFGFGLAAGAWWAAAGPVAITVLFLFISVPLMDRRMRERPGYREVMATTPALLPRLRRGRPPAT
jgi:steroid 5-alpha reductase family enzyme